MVSLPIHLSIYNTFNKMRTHKTWFSKKKDQSKVPSGKATTSNVKPDANIFLSPAAAAGISVASLIAFIVLVGVCLSIWRRRLKRRVNEPDFESVWDGQKFPRNVPTLGERFK